MTTQSGPRQRTGSAPDTASRQSGTGGSTGPPGQGERDVFVLGGGTLGAAVARRLQAEERVVALIDETAEPADVPAHHADPAESRALLEAGLDASSTVIVATPSDSRNLLLAQQVRARFDVERVLVLTNEPERVDVMADAGHEPVCATTALADDLVGHL